MKMLDYISDLHPNGVPIMTGTPVKGETLRCTGARWIAGEDFGPDEEVWTPQRWQWFHNAMAITGAVWPTYELGFDPEPGDRFYCEVTARSVAGPISVQSNQQYTPARVEVEA